VPELLFRKALFRKGFRYSLKNKSFPGNPDLVLNKYGVVIFVNGCFWHQHKNCKYCKLPKSNKLFWKKKILSNVERDLRVRKELKRLGWKVLTVWECEIKKDISKVIDRTIKGIH